MESTADPSWSLDPNSFPKSAGAVPNGYITRNGKPWVDLTPADMGSATVNAISFESNEPWLPHNVAFMMSMVHFNFNQ